MCDGFFARALRTHQEKRLRPPCLALNRLTKKTHSAALAKQRAFDATSRVAQELLRHAQLTLELGRALRDADFEQCIRGLSACAACARSSKSRAL